MRHSLRCSRFASLCLLPVLPLFAANAHANQAQQLVSAINGLRAHPQQCLGRGAKALPPLVLKSALEVPLGYGGGLLDTLRANGYPAMAVRSIPLVGPQSAEEAFEALESRECAALVDSNYTDIGVLQGDGQWQVVLARSQFGNQPLDSRSAAKALLAQVNAARARPRMCGSQHFRAARPLSWSGTLSSAALGHSRDMAREDYFAHQDPDGALPADRARAAGYRGRQIGENIAAGQGTPSAAMAGWLASPGHCANLMDPIFTQVGAAYATNQRSGEGIYWTMDFGAP